MNPANLLTRSSQNTINITNCNREYNDGGVNSNLQTKAEDCEKYKTTSTINYMEKGVV